MGINYPKVCFLHLTGILGSEQQCEAGHHRRGGDGSCRVPSCVLFDEQTKSATRSPTGGDGHVGLHRFDVRIRGS